MSSSPLSIKNHRLCDCVAVESPRGCSPHSQGQMLGLELSVTEMAEVENSHVQHLLQPQLDAQAGPQGEPDVASFPTVMDKDPTGSAELSPFLVAQAIDLSTSCEDHVQLMSGPRTPVSYGEIPNFVFAKVAGDESPLSPPACSSSSIERRSASSAKVCLEKRFDSLVADSTSQQDAPSAVFSNVLTINQLSVEPQEAVPHPYNRWMKTDVVGVSYPFVRGVYDPVTDVCGQVIAHMVEPSKHQRLIIPKSFPCNLNPERVITKIHFTSTIKATEGDKSDKVAPDSAGQSRSNVKRRSRSCMPISQRKELHNIKERERRRKIRLCCDELNTLVPFCDSDTDKVTTLQWTTTFMRYINKTYGDSFKEEFVVFAQNKGLFFNSSSSSSPAPILKEMDDAQSVSLRVEQ